MNDTVSPIPELNRVYHGDCLDVMKSWPAKCLDLVLCSPPYEDCRLYGELQFKLREQDWVDWMVPRVAQACRLSKGPVIIVCEGKTRKFRYSCAPILLMADLHRAGFNLRKPPIFHRIGIAGSGGPDWLRSDYEFCICITPPGRLAWSENTACGHPPKWAPGGEMSHRLTDGTKRNQWGHSGTGGRGARKKDGTHQSGKRPSHSFATKVEMGAKVHTKRDAADMLARAYLPPTIANPGNVIQEKYTAEQVAKLLAESGDVTKHNVGGGQMGSPLAHLNEAAFPETLADFFIRSFCPPGGIVLDCFCGSGTVPAVAEKTGRNWLGIDLRKSQVDLSNRRVGEVRGVA